MDSSNFLRIIIIIIIILNLFKVGRGKYCNEKKWSEKMQMHLWLNIFYNNNKKWHLKGGYL